MFSMQLCCNLSLENQMASKELGFLNLLKSLHCKNCLDVEKRKQSKKSQFLKYEFPNGVAFLKVPYNEYLHQIYYQLYFSPN